MKKLNGDIIKLFSFIGLFCHTACDSNIESTYDIASAKLVEQTSADCQDDFSSSPSCWRVPEEPANEDALRRLSDWRLLPVFENGRHQKLSSYDRESTDDESKPLLKNGNHDMSNFVCASEDTKENVFWTVPAPLYDLEACPEKYVHGRVLARVQGSGRMARLRVARPNALGQPGVDVILRIYRDDETEPFIETPFNAARDGDAGEIFAPPFGAGAEKHMTWYYPVSFSKLLIVALDSMKPADMCYYHVEVVMDEEPAESSPGLAFPALRDQAKTLLSSIEQGPIDDLQPLLSKTSLNLEPNTVLTLADLTGPATIHRFLVEMAASQSKFLDDVYVTVYWDDSKEPAIDLPLGMLMATSLDLPTKSSLALAGNVNGDELSVSLRLPMPFSNRALFQLENRGELPLQMEVELAGEAGVPDKAWGHLYTQANTTNGPTTASHHPLAEIYGRGRYVGTIAMLEGHAKKDWGILRNPMNFLEGDERGYIDGELAIRGTGTEEYFDSALYFNPGDHGRAFSQVWGLKQSLGNPGRGKVSACRWHVLTEAIDFNSSFVFDLEIGPGDSSLADTYKTVAFYYQ